MGRSTFREGKIYEETFVCLFDEIEKKSDTSFDIYPLLQNDVANSISPISFGARSDYEDPNFKEYMESIKLMFELASGLKAF